MKQREIDNNLKLTQTENDKLTASQACDQLNKELSLAKCQNQSQQNTINNQRKELDICKDHIRSLVETLSDLFEYILTKCLHGPPPATSRSQSSIMGGTQDFGNNSVSTDLMCKLFDDERKNNSEFIKNSLIAKFEIINRTISGINIEDHITKIDNWKMIDDYVSEHNSPMNANSVRRSSKLESEIAPFFGLASTHKTNSGSNNSNHKPFLHNDSFQISCPSHNDSKDDLKNPKASKNKRPHRKSAKVEKSDSKHNLVHEDSMMNIGASKLEYDKKNSPIMGAPSIEDIEEEHEENKYVEDEEVIRISRFRNNFTNSEDCDESVIEESKSHDNLTSKGSLSHLVKSISFNELGHEQEPAVVGLKLVNLNSANMNHNKITYNEPAHMIKHGPVSEFSSHSSKKFFGKLNNSTNTLENKSKTSK